MSSKTSILICVTIGSLIGGYIPMLFGAQEYKRLGAWFREQVSPRMVLDIKIDPSVAGGCAFVWKGIYHDFSFKNFMSKHEAELKEAIRIYGRPS